MRITLTTTEPDEIKLLTHAREMSLALWDIYSYLREQWKYAEEPDTIEAIYDKFFDILNENNVADIVLE